MQVDEEQYATSSPLPTTQVKIPTVFNFHEAIDHIMDGRKVTKVEWGDNRIFCELVNGILKIFKQNDEGHWEYFNWIINDGDILGTDWTIA